MSTMRHHNSNTRMSFFKPEPLKLAMVKRMESRNSVIEFDNKSSIIPQSPSKQILKLQNEQL